MNIFQVSCNSKRMLWTVKVGFLSGGISIFDTKLLTKYFQLHSKNNYIPYLKQKHVLSICKVTKRDTASTLQKAFQWDDGYTSQRFLHKSWKYACLTFHQLFLQNTAIWSTSLDAFLWNNQPVRLNPRVLRTICY